MKVLVKWEYMIWQEMYGSGHSNIPLSPSVLVPIEEVVTAVRAVLVQLLAAAAAVRPVPTTTVLGAYFIKSSSESCVAIH